jgi:hypothetical protein
MQEFEISETLDSKFSWVSEWDWKYNKVRAKEKILHSLERKKILHKTLRNLPLKIYWHVHSIQVCGKKRTSNTIHFQNQKLCSQIFFS